MTESLIAPSARARFVVTLPPEPSHVGEQLSQLAKESFLSLTDTKDAFLHLARRAKERLVILTPFIDRTGSSWAADLFEATTASNKILVLRDVDQLDACGKSGERVKQAATTLINYAIKDTDVDGQSTIETFHAKMVLADGVAAYVGSANFLYHSRETNLECGFLLEGDAVIPVATLVEAILAMPSLSSGA